METIDLRALDQLTWTVAVVCKAALGSGAIEIPMKDGSLLLGQLHKDWTPEKIRLQLTALDMKDAYSSLDSTSRNNVVQW